MKTIKELAEEYGVSYRTMWDRITTLRDQLKRAGDARAERLLRKRQVTFGNRERVLVDEELLREVLQELG